MIRVFVNRNAAVGGENLVGSAMTRVEEALVALDNVLFDKIK